jgi:hypothetical protein
VIEGSGLKRAVKVSTVSSFIGKHCFLKALKQGIGSFKAVYTLFEAVFERKKFSLGNSNI